VCWVHKLLTLAFEAWKIKVLWHELCGVSLLAFVLWSEFYGIHFMARTLCVSFVAFILWFNVWVVWHVVGFVAWAMWFKLCVHTLWGWFCVFCGVCFVVWTLVVFLCGLNFMFMFYRVHFVCSMGFALFVLTQGGLFYGLSSRGFWRTPKLLDRFNYMSKGENNGRIRNWGMLFGS
jgi:hypothetical protein